MLSLLTFFLRLSVTSLIVNFISLLSFYLKSYKTAYRMLKRGTRARRLITSTVVDALGRNGALYVDDLYKSVHKMHSGMEKGAFEEIFMLMEFQALIRVYKMPRGKRKAELTKINAFSRNF